MNSIKKQTRKVGAAGGFFNQIMGNNMTLPVVGEGATILHYSDRSAYEVIEVSDDGNSCVIRPMKCKFIGKSYGDERYEYSSNLEANGISVVWNPKRHCWGITTKTVEIQKSLFNKLFDEFGYKWKTHLPVPYESIINGKNQFGNDIFKVVKGITKEYTNFSPISIIFGVMDEYRDPSF